MKLRVKLNDQFYEVEVGDLDSRPITASVDGETFEIWPEEVETAEAVRAPAAASPVATTPPPAPRPAPAPVATVPTAAGGNAVTAPIPGIIVAIKVRVGEEVKSGQELLTLEAMKMNNVIRATRSGKISAIHVSPGDQVRHGQPMIEFAD